MVLKSKNRLTLPVAAASVNEFYGSIHFSMKTTFEVAYKVLESVRFMGFKHIVVIASHADPDHQIAIIKAVRKINRKHGIYAISPMGAIFMGAGVEPSDEIKKLESEHGNDFHAICFPVLLGCIASLLILHNSLNEFPVCSKINHFLNSPLLKFFFESKPP